MVCHLHPQSGFASAGVHVRRLLVVVGSRMWHAFTIMRFRQLFDDRFHATDLSANVIPQREYASADDESK